MIKILIISDSFLPEGVSAAVHMTELQKFYDNAGIETMIGTSAVGHLDIGNLNLINVTRFPNYWRRSNIYILRAIGEFLSAFAIGLILRFSKKIKDINKIVVYSPSVFWAVTLMVANVDPTKVSYVIRDIFPLWLSKANLLRKTSISYRFLDFIAKLQFKNAHKIYVQSSYDRVLLKNEYRLSNNNVHVLHTWMDNVPYGELENSEYLIDVSKKNLLWLGNMGVAQNRDFVISVFHELIKCDENIVLNIVGLKKQDRQVLIRELSKVTTFETQINLLDQLSHTNCAQLAMRCDLGVFSLGWQTTGGNIPGKFITYAMAGLPIFGICEKSAEITSLINKNQLGSCYHGSCKKEAASDIVAELKKDHDRGKIRRYFQKNHSTEFAAETLLE